MTELSAYPATTQWPARFPDRIQLYSVPTPNGVKVSIMLEETALAYEPHLLHFDGNEQKSPQFLSLNLNGKIPAILDPHGPGDAPLALAESGAILIYLAEKSGRFMPQDGAQRVVVLQWLMFQMSAVGPMFGQIGFFHKFAGKEFEDKRPLQRYVAESKRILEVLDRQLAAHDWIAGADYSIADIATFPWINNLIGFYDAAVLVEFERYSHVQRALTRFLSREAVKRGLLIPKRD